MQQKSGPASCRPAHVEGDKIATGSGPKTGPGVPLTGASGVPPEATGWPARGLQRQPV